jgi:hypothetical protein
MLAAWAVIAGVSGCAKAPPATVEVKEVPAQSFVKQWSIDLGSASPVEVESIHVSGDYLFVIGKNRLSYVILKETGKLVTVHAIAELGEILPPFTNGKVFAYPVSTSVEVFGLDGKSTRTVDLKSAVRSTGVYSDDTVFIGVTAQNGGRVRGVDPTRTYDTPKWEVMTFGALLAAPAYYDQTAFFATESGRVYALNDNGQGVWPLTGGYLQVGSVLADLSADSFGLYVASTDTRLIAVNRESGRIIWQYFAGQPLYEQPVPTTETVYLPVRQQGLVALPKLEGDFSRKPKWISREATQFLAEDDRYAYVRLRGNAIGAVRKDSGSVVFRSPGTKLTHFVSNPTAGGLVLGATDDGKVVGIRPVTKPGTVGELMFR